MSKAVLVIDMPERYEINKRKCSDQHYEFEYEYGYNACIDEIIRDE